MDGNPLPPPTPGLHFGAHSPFEEEVKRPSSYPDLKTISRRFRKGSRGRQVASLLLLTLLVALILHASRPIESYAEWRASYTPACGGPRSNPHAIPPPRISNLEQVRTLWSKMQTQFDIYPTVPATVSMPAFKKQPSRDKLENLLNVTDGECLATRLQHANLIRHLPVYPEKLFSGRGIVVLAGGIYSEYAATAVGMIRETGSKLPVEIWMKDQAEEKPGWCKEVEREGMICRRLVDYMDVSILRHPYQMKVFTMLFSAFEEMIFLDADDMPLKNMDNLFEAKEYGRTGVILWPDYWVNSGSPWLPYVLGLSDGPSDMLKGEMTVESGQIVWHKKRHWKSLCLATYYNFHGPNYYYSLISQGWSGWGDKDTFPMALKAMQETYYQVPHDILTLFPSGSSHGIGMLQADPANPDRRELMFMHSNMVKLSATRLLCADCKEDDGKKIVSHLANPDSPIVSLLQGGRRIFEPKDLIEHGVDPEPTIWKALEHTACRSVWGNKQMCSEARKFMTTAFGFSFERSKTTNGEELCAVDPVHASKL